MSDQVLSIKPGQLGATIRGAALAQHKAVQRGIKVAKQRAIALLKSRTPVDQGIMKAAWKATQFGIENDAPHGGIVEAGARPHKVNAEGVAAIREWVIRKQWVHVSDPTAKTAKARKLRPYSRGDEAAGFGGLIDSIVWAIIKKIEREGQKATWFVRDSMDEIAAFVEDEVLEQLARAVAGRGDYFGRDE